MLIRTDGNTDFVHVLGRRTRIGRGSDNELVLDTKHISRYHAVLLAGPVHTSIEDLNSTNGVFVNGKRVSRQALKDGDRVTVGRSRSPRYTRPRHQSSAGSSPAFWRARAGRGPRSKLSGRPAFSYCPRSRHDPTTT